MPVNPPKCKVCGSAHWGVRHQFGPVAEQDTAPRSRPGRAATREVAGSSPAGPAILQPVKVITAKQLLEEFPPSPKLDRKAYMRAYMAKKRAGLRK